jgi:predicted MFS family arabinose efflux permease
MATAALFTCMMDWCSPDASGTDYTVQASAVVTATGIAAAVAGFSAQTFGYFGHFALSTALALGALVVLRRLFPTDDAARRIRAESTEALPCA